MVNGPHLFCAFPNQWPLKALYNIASHSLIHTPTAVSTTKGGDQVVVRGRCLAQEDLDTQLGGAGDRTSNLPVPIHPTLPPERHAAEACFYSGQSSRCLRKSSLVLFTILTKTSSMTSGTQSRVMCEYLNTCVV